ncbi:MAG: MmcQ/YjbR family DNA-binding protein [Candidatus Thermoplasmatota archaeon]|nr:MmcQ/YjbR family DNA-binding protein [Candidatus Thermoplasmatota archaeon]
MDLKAIMEHVKKKPGVKDDFPFDLKTLCVRVGGKIFLLADIHSEPLRVNLKCDPRTAIDLREEFDSITPGYHMNKVHWNTVIFDGSIPADRLLEMIDHSYEQVLSKMKKSEREMILSS